MSKQANPFVFGGPVVADQFVGRNNEVNRVFDQLCSHELGSVAIVGERRIGKTSLMHFVSAADVCRQWNLDETQSIFIFQDCGAIAPFTIANFWKTILRRLKRNLMRKRAEQGLRQVVQELLEEDEISTIDVEFLLDDIHAAGYLFVLLLDEFEWCIRTDPENEAMTRGFLGGLRALINHVPRVLSLIVSTRQPLNEVCQDIRFMGSPFYNNFVFIHLRPFSQEEADLLLAQMLNQTDITFSEDERAYIYDLAGTQPLLLQVAAGLIFDAKVAGAKEVKDFALIRQQFRELVAHQFEDFWKWSQPQEREILTLLARGQYQEAIKRLESWTDERESLIRRGLIFKNEDGDYRFLSSSFWEWLIDNLYHLEEIHRPHEPEISHLQQQLTAHQRRLDILELQAAKFGELHVPPHLLIDIEDTKVKISSLRFRINESYGRGRAGVDADGGCRV
jgi:serine/threonine-protein kinase